MHTISFLMQVLILQKRERRGVLNPTHPPREAYLWREISSYFVTAYANERAWVRALRQGLGTYSEGATK